MQCIRFSLNVFFIKGDVIKKYPGLETWVGSAANESQLYEIPAPDLRWNICRLFFPFFAFFNHTHHSDPSDAKEAVEKILVFTCFGLSQGFFSLFFVK